MFSGEVLHGVDAHHSSGSGMNTKYDETTLINMFQEVVS